MKIIILTGGTSKRFGSDKSIARINGQTLLQILVANLDSTELVIVGPETPIAASYIQEEPLFGGPVAAIGAGMKDVETELVGIFATDMPFAPLVISQLKKSLQHDAALPIDNEGHLQPLAAIYRTSALKSALSQFSTWQNQSVRDLIGKLHVDRVKVRNPEYLLDIDTPADLNSAIDLHSKLMQ